MMRGFLRQYRLYFFWLLLPVFDYTPERYLTTGSTAKTVDFAAYTETVDGTTVSFEMLPVPGGKFMMGSPPAERGRRRDEGPVHPVQVDSFWMAKLEITWDEYEIFVFPELEKEQNKNASPETGQVDAVTRPTPPFVDMSFGMGKNGYPAVNMTRYAALGYCKWLTAKTGHFYRIPTEAEWEYACRAGSTTPYSFGDNINALGEYAWYNKNSSGKYHKVGTKKPNQWGLYDMHGNVAEWTLDQYIPGFYSSFNGKEAVNPWAKPDRLYPHAVRGGSWDDGAENLRSSARMGSNPKWKKRDPQIPRSNWWNTDASFVGFRILRPVTQPTAEQIAEYFAAPIKDL